MFWCEGSHKCQQFCYATPGCSAFTHFEQSKKEDRKCVLFRDCNGKLSSCQDCIRCRHPVSVRPDSWFQRSHHAENHRVYRRQTGGGAPCRHSRQVLFLWLYKALSRAQVSRYGLQSQPILASILYR